MRLPVHDFSHKWYDAQPFGTKTNYGYHEGCDLNLKTGGDTDFGEPVYCIAKGVVTSVHRHTTSGNFGYHLHVKHEGAWGTVWSHYAHCSDIMVAEGETVAEGKVIAKVGKSGTVYSHLHFAIKLEPTGIEGIAKTTEQLKKWTDPLKFIKQWTVVQEPDMNQDEIMVKKSTFEDLVGKATKYDALKAEGVETASDVQSIKAREQEAKTGEQRALDEAKGARESLTRIAKALNSPQDEARMIAAISECMTNSDTATKTVKTLTSKLEGAQAQEVALQAEVTRLTLIIQNNKLLSGATLAELFEEFFRRIAAIVKK